MLAFVFWVNDLTLGLGLEAKKIERGAIWNLIVLGIIIAKLNITAKLGWVITSFETKWVVTALEEGKPMK